jgi:hypothetical protein
MPGTPKPSPLETEIQNLRKDVDSVKDNLFRLQHSTDSIKAFTDYQMMLTEIKKIEPKNHSVNQTRGYIETLLPLLIIIVWRLGKFLKYKKKKEILKINGVEAFNVIWVIIWLACAIIFTRGLVDLGLIHFPYNGFEVSHLDLVLAIASIIAVIGAVWAVYARIDADRAFKKSEQTLDAIGSTFDFEEILNNDKIVEIITSIGNSDTKIHLFLGFPCIGYLYKDKPIFKNTPEILFMNFIDRLSILSTRLAGDQIKNFELNLAVFSFEDCKDLLSVETKDPEDSSKVIKKYSPIMKNEVDTLEDFYKKIETLKKLKNPSIKIIEIQRNENLRYASIQLQNQPAHKSKSIVWIVKDLVGEVRKFDSAAFQSSDTKLLAVLRTVFD